MPLNDVTIVITAGFRPGYLNNALLGIRRNLPECKVVVANDDGYTPAMGQMALDGNVIWKELPRDTFLTRKRNEAVKLVDTEYTLMASDDFDFTVDVRASVIRMSRILDAGMGNIIGGTVNDRRYEGYLTVNYPEYIKETRLIEDPDKSVGGLFSSPKNIWKVDIVANWFLANTRVLRQHPWDETIGPIGGEHADWFIDLKVAKRTVLWTPGLNIYEQPHDKTMEYVFYPEMRRRCWEGHNLFLAKRGIKRYYGFDEEVKE
jgi:hypothetical protein